MDEGWSMKQGGGKSMVWIIGWQCGVCFNCAETEHDISYLMNMVADWYAYLLEES